MSRHAVDGVDDVGGIGVASGSAPRAVVIHTMGHRGGEKNGKKIESDKGHNSFPPSHIQLSHSHCQRVVVGSICK